MDSLLTMAAILLACVYLSKNMEKLVKAAGESAGETAVKQIGDAAGQAGDAFLGRDPNWQFAAVSYYAFLQNGSPELISFTLNHKGPAGSYLAGAYLKDSVLGSGEIGWDINTIVSVGNDADWVGYRIRLSRPVVAFGQGIYEMHLYVRTNADMLVDNRQFGTVQIL